MRSIHLLLTAALALSWLSQPIFARELADALYCCSADRPCWGWGDQQGKCCRTPENGGCKGASRCKGGLTPDSFNAVCGTGGAAAADSAPAKQQKKTPAAATTTPAATAIPADLAAAYAGASPRELALLAAQVAAQEAINAGSAAAVAAAQQQAQQAAVVEQQPAARQAAGAAGSSGGGGGAGRAWTNIRVNRFGDYSNFGQGRGWMGTVSCTGRMAPPAGLWTAMNFAAMGLPSLPCGMGLTVTNPATGASVHVTVVDGGGSDGLDLDDAAYRAIMPAGVDGLVGGITVTAD